MSYIDDTLHEDWIDGYNDGVLFHIDFNFDAKDEDRYDNNEDYRRGFDQAGEDG